VRYNMKKQTKQNIIFVSFIIIGSVIAWSLLISQLKEVGIL